MKVITATKRKHEILVDDEDFESLNLHRWNIGGGGYALRLIRVPGSPPGKYRSEYMHRRIMGLKFGDPGIVDHVNRIITDNRRSNLRICTRAENTRNRAASKISKSGIKGVSWCVRDERWVAHITFSHKQKNLGSFHTKEDALEAYTQAAIRLHGAFASIPILSR
jgi:hypothetical protein